MPLPDGSVGGGERMRQPGSHPRSTASICVGSGHGRPPAGPISRSRKTCSDADSNLFARRDPGPAQCQSSDAIIGHGDHFVVQYGSRLSGPHGCLVHLA
jgi:hypothetical protein